MRNYTDIEWIGYTKISAGHWEIMMDFEDGSTFSCITTDSTMIDEWDGQEFCSYYVDAKKAAAEAIAFANEIDLEVKY